MISTKEEIRQALDQLSEKNLIEVSKFIKSLQETKEIKKRQAGLSKGLITMSKDFDEPLEEFKCFGS